jgi:hypothetical protein
VIDRWSGTGSAKHAQLAWCSLFFLFYAVLVNVPFWVASHSLGLLQKGYFDPSYALAGISALFLRRIPSAILLLFVMVVDLLASVCLTFYLSLSECWTNLLVLRGLSPAGHAAIASVILLALVSVVASSLLPASSIQGIARRRIIACLLGVIVCCLSVDLVSIAQRNRDAAHFPTTGAHVDGFLLGAGAQRARLTRPSEFRLLRNEIAAARNRRQSLQDGVQTASSPVSNATSQALRYGLITAGESDREMPNVALILLESWGKTNNRVIEDGLLAPYFRPDLLARYKLFQGTVPFFGSTVPGEGRELCGNTVGFGIETASAEQLRDCIPNRLATLGFHNIAIHGADGHSFQRLTWYKTIGFEERWFGDRLRQEGLPDCSGAFLGTCDADVAGWISRRLEKPGAAPEFVYWVTLNSHLPVLVPTGLPSAASCAIAPALEQQLILCSWYQLVANVHRAVAQLAMTGSNRPTVWIIVGDHAPPFASLALREQFSSHVVPYLLLVPTERVYATRSGKAE